MKKLLIYMKGFRKECVLGPLFKLLEASFELLGDGGAGRPHTPLFFGGAGLGGLPPKAAGGAV